MQVKQARLTSLSSLLKTYCCVTTSNQLRSTSSPRWASSHSFSLMRAVTWVLKASSLRPDKRSPKLTRNSSIFASTNSVLREQRRGAFEQRSGLWSSTETSAEVDSPEFSGLCFHGDREPQHTWGVPAGRVHLVPGWNERMYWTV